MAISYDNTAGVVASGTGNLSWTHTGAASGVKGVVVQIVQNVGTTDEVTNVNYGTLTLTRVAAATVFHTAGAEDGAVYTYVGTSGIPQGAQTVNLVVNATGSNKDAHSYTFLATGDTRVIASNTADTANTGGTTASVSLVGSAGIGALAVGCLHSSVNQISGMAAGTGTTEVEEVDLGNQCGSFTRLTAITAGTITYGWTVTANTEAGIGAVALVDTAITSTPTTETATLSDTIRKESSRALSTETGTLTDTLQTDKNPITRGVSGFNQNSGTTTVEVSLGTVTAGSLLVVYGFNEGSITWLASHLTQSAGDATLATNPIMHREQSTSTNHIGCWSWEVTGTGTCTLRLTAASATYMLIGAVEYIGASLDEATRYKGGVGSTSSLDSGTYASGEAGVFFGCGSTSIGTDQTWGIHASSGHTLRGSQGAGSTYATGAMSDRIVSADTTDRAYFTFTGSGSSDQSQQLFFRKDTGAAAKSCTETATLSDTIEKASGQSSRTETSTLSDSILKAVAIFLIEAITLTDSITTEKVSPKSVELTETATLSDGTLKLRSLAIPQNLSLTDTTTKAEGRQLVETATLSDTLSRQANWTRELEQYGAAGLNLTDTVGKATDRALSETATLADTLARQATWARTLSESTTLGDSIYKAETRSVAETATLGDTLAAARSFNRDYSEGLTLSDSLLKAEGRSLTESSTLSDSIQKAETRSVVETATLADQTVSAEKGGGVEKGPVNLTDTATLTDGTLKVRSLGIPGSLLLSDSKYLGESRALTETATLADTIQTVSGLVLPETATLTDTVQKASSRALSETATLADSVVAAIEKGPVNLSETATLTDGTLRRGVLPRETITLADSVVSSKLAVQLTETATLSDTCTPVKAGLSVQLTETLYLADDPLGLTGVRLWDTVTLTDTCVAGRTKSLSETLTLTDSQTRLKNGVPVGGVNPTETLTVADSVQKATSIILLEALSLSDTVNKALPKTFTETLTLGDSPLKASTVNPSGTLTLSDGVWKTSTRVLNEVLTLTGTYSSTKITLVETLTLTDTLLGMGWVNPGYAVAYGVPGYVENGYCKGTGS